MASLMRSSQWRKHLFPILFVVFGMILMGITYWLSYSAQQQLSNAKRALNSQQQLNQNAARSKQVFDDSIERYRHFQDAGVIGPPDKLNWIETLRSLTETLEVPSVTFQTGKQVHTNPEEDIFYSETLQVTRIPMTLSANLRHEGDFYRLFNNLLELAHGRFIMQECDITRDESVEQNIASRSLTSKCTLQWYNIAAIQSAQETPQQGDDFLNNPSSDTFDHSSEVTP